MEDAKISVAVKGIDGGSVIICHHARADEVIYSGGEVGGNCAFSGEEGERFGGLRWLGSEETLVIIEGGGGGGGGGTGEVGGIGGGGGGDGGGDGNEAAARGDGWEEL